MCVNAISPSFALWQEKSDVYTLKNTSLPVMGWQYTNLLLTRAPGATACRQWRAGAVLLDQLVIAPKRAGSASVFFRRRWGRIKFKQLVPQAVFFNLEHFGQLAGNKPHGLFLQAALAKRKLLGAADEQKFA